MPLPSPQNKEKRGDFLKRCMLELGKKGEFPDAKQRAAVCHSQFDEGRSKASVIVGQRGDEILFFSKSANENRALNKPFRTPKGPKKFSVYVKNEKGNIVKVNFGDPNMEIKRDDPARRKSFRARHNCDNPGPKWKARYWSCKQWRAGKKVEGSLEGEYEWDGETFFDKDEIEETLAKRGLWENIRRKKKREGKDYKPAKVGDSDRPDPKSWKKAQGEDDPNAHYFDTKEEALKDAGKLGLKGYHTHKTEDGKSLYMAGPSHEAFMKRHKEIVDKK
jgi:hypothetical protein|tara:strand:- start:3568 stop:4395 length:828 start_codon:yes stop_codon:yes gene_type:complete